MADRPGQDTVFRPRDALALIRDEFELGFDEFSTPRSVLVVQLEDEDGLDQLVAAARTLPCVVIGVAEGEPDAPNGFDILLSASSATRPWVQEADLGSALAGLIGCIEASPHASVALAELLRLSAASSIDDAIVAESFVYSMLQSGPTFGTWLGGRRPPRMVDREPSVLVTRSGGLLEVELNRPSARNALNAEMRDGLLTVLHMVVADESIVSVRLSGRGPDFSSGGDLSEFGSAEDPATAHLVRVSRSIGRVLARCAERVMVDLHGACVGAGIEVPAFAERVRASEDTRLRLPEVGFGLVPGAGGTVSIPRRIGRHRATYLAISGAWLDAPTALDWGLVDEVGPAAAAS
ncbi:MAG: enoyl-CoA hydratase/isomerase family protein [Acidimicrobiales bacterium]